MAETDVFSDLGSTLIDEHIFDAINVIRYKKRKRPDRESIYKQIQEKICVTNIEFSKLLDSLIEDGSVHVKETNEGKESFFNNEDLLESRLAELMTTLYDKSNDESLQSDDIEEQIDTCAGTNCCKKVVEIVQAHTRRIDTLFNDMNLRLFTSLSEERNIICKLTEEMTSLKQENKNLRDKINAKSSSKATVGTQTIVVTKEIVSETEIFAKEIATVGNQESLSSKINRQLNRARNNSKNKFYAYKEAISRSPQSTKDSNVFKDKSNAHEVVALESIQSTVDQDQTASDPPAIESKQKESSLKAAESKTKASNLEPSENSARINQIKAWPRGTTLLVGDSMIGGIFEKWISPAKKMKVRSFPGAVIDDLYDYMRPLLRKRPSNVIIHCGTNDSMTSSAKEIADKLLLLRKFVLSELNDCNVILSSPVNRLDSTQQGIIVRNVNVILKNTSGIEVIDNSNISAKHLGKKKLHLNPSGSTILTRNILNSMKCI